MHRPNLVVPARTRIHPWAVSVVVITSALHAEGRQFEPGTDQYFYHAYILHLFLLKKVLAKKYMLI